jgi:hypothetical protein
MVAGLGRMSSASALRYDDLPLPQPPSVAAAPARDVGLRQRSVRRRSGIAYVLGGMFLLGMPLAAWLNWDTQPRVVSLLELAFGAGCGTASYLAGPAARFVVTQHHLHIDAALHRVTVPRHLLGEFMPSGAEVRLNLTDASRVYFRVDSPIWDLRGGEYRTNGRARFRTVEKIVAMLSEVPAVAGAGGGVVRTPRHGMRALAVAATLVSAGAFIALAVVAFV